MEFKFPKDFKTITNDILENKEFYKLKNELHHGISRYEHSMRVAKTTYKIGRILRLKKLEETTRAALMHDFYIDSEFNDEKPQDRLYMHPVLAVNNAQKLYELTDLEQNIIKSHMYPLKGEKPKYKESWLVSSVDKAVACYEMPRYKASLAISVWFLFLFNLLIIQK